MTNTTKTLEELGDEAVEKFNLFIKDWTGTWYPHLIDTDDNEGQFFRNYLDSFAEKVWGLALDACRENLPEERDHHCAKCGSGEFCMCAEMKYEWNACRKEALDAIDSLRTGGGKE